MHFHALFMQLVVVFSISHHNAIQFFALYLAVLNRFSDLFTSSVETFEIAHSKIV